MGCASSSSANATGDSQLNDIVPSSPPANDTKQNKKQQSQKQIGTNATSTSSTEDSIHIALKNKRANVFTQGIEFDSDNQIALTNIPKTEIQTTIIINALSENFVFSSLDKETVKTLVNAVELKSFAAGEAIITQGEEGDYFYVIESGVFSVIVNNKQVAVLEDGKGPKSFGELALLHNAKRAATVKAVTPVTVFLLDRRAFRYTVASSSQSKATELHSALAKVPLLSSLTDKQLHRVSETVEIIPFKAGDVIIRKGEAGNIFYIVKDGSVLVTEVSDQFQEQTLKAGDYFGERALLTGEPRAATVKAVTNVSLIAIDRESFNSLLGPLHDIIDQNMNQRVLSSIKLFANLNDQERQKVSKSFSLQKFTTNATIIKQGDKGSTFYIVKDGKVKVIADNVTIVELQTGAHFGEMALLDDEVRKATVQAVTPTECFVIDRLTFTKILGNMQQILSREVKSRMELLKGVSRDDALEQLNLKFGSLTEKCVLGTGTFGRVTLVQDKHSKNVYALKAILKSEIIAHKQQANVMNEKNVMMSCNNPFILRLFQTFKDNKRVYMLLEFIQGGELFSVLHTQTTDGVPDAHAKFYGAGVLIAIAYLHSKEIAYRDMKPENCLIDSKGYPKLVDFGFAKVIHGKSFTLCGTPEYLSPELVLGKGHNKSVDYWAFGILLYEMQAGYSPFADNQNMDQVAICRNIVNGRLAFPKTFNPECKELVKRLLSREIHTRLGNLKGGADDIKNHEWFNSLDMGKYTKKELPAPWVPKLMSNTDTSNFDGAPDDDHIDTGFVDKSNWDKDF